jgi:hypothetical protein
VALACYGLLRTDTNGVWLRFVDGRPISEVSIAFLEWVCQELQREGKKALLLVWDNASWHISQPVTTQDGYSLRPFPCVLRSQ